MRDLPDLDHLVRDPWEHFASPMDVVTEPRLDRDDKRKILESWALDAELLSKAEAENMSGGDRPKLQAVKLALLELDKQ
jgi:ABC-type iron transport system FetAB ATPase subunit